MLFSLRFMWIKYGQISTFFSTAMLRPKVKILRLKTTQSMNKQIIPPSQKVRKVSECAIPQA